MDRSRIGYLTAILTPQKIEEILLDQFDTLDHPGIPSNLLNASIILEDQGPEKFEFIKKQFAWWTESMNNVRGFDIFELQPQLRQIIA
jgi:hypothetical protein